MIIRRMRRMRRRTVSKTRKMSIRSLSRRIRKRQARQPEVKYNDFVVEDTEHNIQVASPASETLFGGQHKISGLLSGIGQGVGRNQRIGNRINVKFIKITMLVRGCSSSADYNVADFLLRCIVSNTGASRIVAGADITGYFSPGSIRNVNGLINRTRIYVKFDKTYTIRTGWVHNGVNPDSTTGAVRRLTLIVPFGKIIEYTNGAMSVKNDHDYLSLIMIVGTPGMSVSTNGRQIACSDIIVRTYFTDV